LSEDVLAKGKRDISRTVTEDFARRNIRGPRASNVIAGRVADYSKDLRFSDMLRALEGRQFLLGQGTDALSGVRSGALSQTGLRSQFDLNKAELELKAAGLGMERSAAKGSLWSNILSNAIPGITKLGSAFLKSKKVADPTGTYDVGYGSGFYPGNYSDLSGL